MASLKTLMFGAAALLELSAAQFLSAAPIQQLHRRQLAACADFLSFESSCEAATPTFSDISYTSQLACLCDPGASFDSAFGGCLDYVSTASPALYRSLTNLGLPSSPCAADGPAATSATTTSTSAGLTTSTSTSRSGGGGGIISPTSSGVNDPNLAACTSFVSIENACSAATSSFSDLPARSQASCLCYDGGSYAPEIFDGYHDSCIAYFQTADPPRYQSLVRQSAAATSICSSIFGAGGAGGSSTSSSSSSRTTSRTSTISRPTASSTTTTSATAGPNAAPSGVVGGLSLAAAMGALALAIAL